MISIDVYIILFLLGYFGGFRYLADIFNKYMPDIQRYEWLNGEVIVEIFLFIITICVYSRLLKKGIKEYKKIDINEISTIFLVISILGMMITYIFGVEEKSALDLNVNNNFKIHYLIAPLIYAPVIEELFCRNGIMRVFEEQFRMTKISAIILSSLVFSLLHVIKQNDAALNIITANFLIYLVSGFGCGYVYKNTDNIFSSIILHILWNFSIIAGGIVRMAF